MTDFWQRMIVAFLHDPPDKALDIKGHLSRARRYLKAVLGQDIDPSDLDENKSGDVRASIEDRLPMPDYRRGEGKGAPVDESLVVSFQSDARQIVHPLSGAMRQLSADLKLDESRVEADLADLRRMLGSANGVDGNRRLFFALWRLLPSRFSKGHNGHMEDYALLPAETRAPDHSIWNHLDLASAFYAALRGKAKEGTGGALLSFTLGPVQPFIAAARSLRDLWSGSYMLSWLTFKAMLPIIEELGPTALIYPSLRGNPMFDGWLCGNDQLGAVPELKQELERDLTSVEGPDARLMASLPNTFMALVPAGRIADELANKCRLALLEEWSAIERSVRKHLQQGASGIAAGWDRGWDEQVRDFFDVRTSVLPMGGSEEELQFRFNTFLHGQAWPPSRELKDLQDALRANKLAPAYGDSAGSWALHTELAGRLMAAQKSVRQVRPHTAENDDRPKCSMFPGLEQMGPGGSPSSQRKFWESLSERSPGLGARIRANERLSAIGLVKRFFWSAYLKDTLALQAEALRFDDTATIAAACWLEKGKKEPELAGTALDIEKIRKSHRHWSGQWLHSSKDGDDDPCPKDLPDLIRKQIKAIGKPPTYYAVLALDGDQLGDWLRGRLAPRLDQCYHPKMIAALKSKLGSRVESLLAAKRPLSPALHTTISAALNEFALVSVPKCVDRAKGQTVYAGGDDVLAVLPTEKAFACAEDLRRSYQQDWGLKGPLMGALATVSAGLAIVHYKSDLREAIEAARQAEHAAKRAGRNALGLGTLKRSGEHATVVVPWSYMPVLNAFTKAFVGGASDGWAHQLRADMVEIAVNGKEAIQNEIIRVVARGESSSLQSFEQQLGDLVTNPVDEPKAAQSKYRAGFVAGAFNKLFNSLSERKQGEQPTAKQQDELLLTAYAQFIMCVQAASFMARGRDE